jgi:TatD DNase family protein
VNAVINVGSTVETSQRGVELARSHPNVYAAVGCHPHDAEAFDDAQLKTLEGLCSDPRVKAVGEIGLDYFRTLSSPESQRRVFHALIDLSLRTGLPMVVHTRQAQEETLAILKEKKVSRAIIHCFSGDAAFLSACLDMGFYVSFTCTITYKKAGELREAARLCPLDRVCVETDAPYLPPEGRRGQRNEPASAAVACEMLAQVKGIPYEVAAEATTANAKRFFGI